MLLNRYSIGFALARATNDAFPISPPVRTQMASHHAVQSITLPINLLVAKIQSTMYRFPSIASLVNVRSITKKSFNSPFGSSQAFRSHLTSTPTLLTSSNEYRFPSIGIRSRSQEKHESSRSLRARHLSHNARSAFAFL